MSSPLSLKCTIHQAFPSQVKCGPVRNVEYEENDGKRDEDGHVQLAGLVFLQRGHDLAEGLDLHLEQDDGVLEERAKDEEDAADDPRLHGVEAVSLRGVGGGGVEDVDLEKLVIASI